MFDFIKIFYVYVQSEEIEEIAARLSIEKELINRQIKYKYDYEISNILGLFLPVIIFYALIFFFNLLVRISIPEKAISSDLLPDDITYSIITTLIISVYFVYFVYLFIYYKYLVNFSDYIIYGYFTSVGGLSFMIVTTITYLLVELNHLQALEDMNLRTNILRRIKNLVRLNRLLSLKMSNQNTSYQEWITEHFRKIEFFVWERSRWAIIPISSSRET